MISRSEWRMLLLVALAVLWSPSALAQGDCRISGAGEDAVWVSVAPLAGGAVNVPTAGTMHVRKATAAFGGEVTLNLPRRFAAGVMASYSYFQGQMSHVYWVRHLDLLAVGHFPLVIRERVDWTLLVAAGTSLVSKQFMHQAKPHVEPDGEVTYTGEVRRLNMWTATGGFGSRVTVYPVDPVGIFAQFLVTYSYYKALELEEGPCNALLTGGVEVHF